ncbi:hypothetical protein [Methylobacterium komagatae]
MEAERSRAMDRPVRERTLRGSSVCNPFCPDIAVLRSRSDIRLSRVRA